MDNEFNAKYGALANELGFDTLARLVLKISTIDELAEKLAVDPYLNNIPMHKWDWIGGYDETAHDYSLAPYHSASRGLARRKAYALPLYRNWINGHAIDAPWKRQGKPILSAVERVCVLKYVASKMVEDRGSREIA